MQYKYTNYIYVFTYTLYSYMLYIKINIYLGKRSHDFERGGHERVGGREGKGK